MKKAADAKKAEEQKGLDKAKKELADATTDLAKKLEQPKKDLARVQNEKKEVDQAKDDETRLATELTALGQVMDRAQGHALRGHGPGEGGAGCADPR